MVKDKKRRLADYNSLDRDPPTIFEKWDEPLLPEPPRAAARRKRKS